MNTRLFLLTIFLISLYGMFVLYHSFLLTILISILLCISLYPTKKYIEKHARSNAVASTCSTLILCLIIFSPSGYIVTHLNPLISGISSDQITLISQKVMNANITLPPFISFLQDDFDELVNTIMTSGVSKETLKSIASVATLAGRSWMAFLKDIIFIIIFFLFIHLYAKDLLNYIKQVTPLKSNVLNYIFKQMGNTMSVLLYSILVTAVFEGTLFAFLGIWLGYDALLLGIMYGISSLIPVVGGLLMWLPLALYELSLGHTTNALIVVLYSIIVISIIADTFIKPIIIKKVNSLTGTPTKINELLIFFAIIAGLGSFGFWGMLLGPAITAFFITILDIYRVLAKKHKK